MKAVLVPWLAGVLWVGALAVSVPSAEPVWGQTALPVAGDPWFSTSGTCDCDPCHDPGLWAGYCAERAAYYAHRRHFWQKVHCVITLGWLPKLHAGCDHCCPQAVPSEVLSGSEQPTAELQQPAESQPPLPPPPQRDARQLRLPLRAAVAAQAQGQPVLRGLRKSWVQTTKGKRKEPSQFPLGWSKVSWFKGTDRKQSD